MLMPSSDIMPQCAIPVNRLTRLPLTFRSEDALVRILHLANGNIAHLADASWTSVRYNGVRPGKGRGLHS